MQASGTSARERLPSQRRDRSGLAPDSLTARRLWTRDYHRRADGQIARSHAVGSRRALGGGDLCALVDSEPRHRARHVGLRAAQVRAHDGVRDPRGAPLPRARTAAARVLRRARVRCERRVPPALRARTPRHAGGRCDRRRRNRRWIAGVGTRAAVTAVAVDLDGALGDTRRLWKDWLEDAGRRARIDVTALDDELPNWRRLLQ